MRRTALVTGILLSIAIPTQLVAQAPSFGVAPHIGTLGIGAFVGVGLHPRVTLRAGGGVFPFDFDITSTDTEFTIDLPSPQWIGIVDLFVAGGFRVSGGAMFSPPDIEATGLATGTVDVGGVTYSATEAGNLTGAIVNNDIAPYIGIGFGNVARGGFIVDLGVALQGEPAVTLTADGTLAQNPQFQADLNSEVADLEEEIKFFKYYPIVSFGFSIGF